MVISSIRYGLTRNARLRLGCLVEFVFFAMYAGCAIRTSPPRDEGPHDDRPPTSDRRAYELDARSGAGGRVRGRGGAVTVTGIGFSGSRWCRRACPDPAPRP